MGETSVPITVVAGKASAKSLGGCVLVMGLGGLLGELRMGGRGCYMAQTPGRGG